ncbi:porin [Comamonas sp. GB3 AK4-5]|uniref:porin n=1 Tax=Comamonas sp. GB3 AK4-5 TaxID=3231487 RepID=UPI00351F2FD6
MKKSLIALAVMAASGAAMAQSSVTLFGVVDEAVTYANGGQNWSGINSGGNATSRLGFRGTEDLGGGLKANFWLEGAVGADDGGSGLDFKRRSTVGLEGGFGEVRLGRELTAAYNAVARYDVFGNVGIGNSRMWADGSKLNAGGLTGVQLTNNRVSNAITYITPNFSGFKAAANYGFGEETGSNRGNRYLSAGLTYDNGPLSLGLGLERQNRTEIIAGGRDVTAWSLGGSYNLGVVKLAAAYKDSQSKIEAGDKDKFKGFMLGLSAPVGTAGEVKASYNHYENKYAIGADGKLKADQFALGYVHNLSKRTAVYGTYAFIKNKNNDGANLGINLNSDKGGTLKDSGKQQAIQVGIRHSF